LLEIFKHHRKDTTFFIRLLILCLKKQTQSALLFDYQLFAFFVFDVLICGCLLYLKKKAMAKFLVSLFMFGYIHFSFAQTAEKVQFEYTSFSVVYNDNGEQKFKQSEDLIQSVSRSLKTERKEIDKAFYYAKTADENMMLLGKSGFELVTSTQVRTKDGIEIRFYFKKKIVL